MPCRTHSWVTRTWTDAPVCDTSVRISTVGPLLVKTVPSRLQLRFSLFFPRWGRVCRHPSQCHHPAHRDRGGERGLAASRLFKQNNQDRHPNQTVTHPAVHHMVTMSLSWMRQVGSFFRRRPLLVRIDVAIGTKNPLPWGWGRFLAGVRFGLARSEAVRANAVWAKPSLDRPESARTEPARNGSQ